MSMMNKGLKVCYTCGKPGHNKAECPTTGGDGGKARREWKQGGGKGGADHDDGGIDDLHQPGKKVFGDLAIDNRPPPDLSGGGKVGTGGRSDVYDPTLDRPSKYKRAPAPPPPPASPRAPACRGPRRRGSRARRGAARPRRAA